MSGVSMNELSSASSRGGIRGGFSPLNNSNLEDENNHRGLVDEQDVDLVTME